MNKRSYIVSLLCFVGTSDLSLIAGEEKTTEYGVDVSWPIHYPWSAIDTEDDRYNERYPNQENEPASDILSDRKKIYNNFMEGCRKYFEKKPWVCDEDESDRILGNLEQPAIMMNFTEVGYKKTRAPEKLYNLVKEFWDKNKDSQYKESFGIGSVIINYWDNPSYVLDILNEELDGGGPDLFDAINEATVEAIEEWVGMKINPVSTYGIRIYKEGSILTPHVDRTPLISSVIINVAQDVDEDWPLEVIGHDGIAHNVTMEPGDMVLYESHSIIHGRPFALSGRYFANIFVHFEPYEDSQDLEDSDELPIFLSPDITDTLKDIYLEKVTDYDDMEEFFPHDDSCMPEDEDCVDGSFLINDSDDSDDEDESDDADEDSSDKETVSQS